MYAGGHLFFGSGCHKHDVADASPPIGMNESEQQASEATLQRVVQSAGLEALVANHPGVRTPATTSRSKGVVKEIFKATTELIAAEGVRGITTDQIARSAKVSTATVYRYFADFEGVFMALGAHIWWEDLSLFATRLIGLAEGADPDIWVEVLVSDSPDGSPLQPARRFVARTMDGVPSMRSVVAAGHDTGGRLLACSLELRAELSLTPELQRDCRAVYRMLHSGLDAVLPESATGYHGVEGYLEAASALLSDLVQKASYILAPLDSENREPNLSTTTNQ